MERNSLWNMLVKSYLKTAHIQLHEHDLYTEIVLLRTQLNRVLRFDTSLFPPFQSPQWALLQILLA